MGSAKKVENHRDHMERDPAVADAIEKGRGTGRATIKSVVSAGAAPAAEEDCGEPSRISIRKLGTTSFRSALTGMTSRARAYCAKSPDATPRRSGACRRSLRRGRRAQRPQGVADGRSRISSRRPIAPYPTGSSTTTGIGMSGQERTTGSQRCVDRNCAPAWSGT
jgi:hypothetical protein